jgi:hypothetical protein
VAGPLDLVASMVLDNGTRWGDAATEDQWADMKALLSPDGPRRHFWLRARGRSKTHDCAAASLAMMLAGGIRPADEMYAAASGKYQAGFLIKKIRGIAANTPELAGAVDIQNYRVVTPRTGAALDVISADLASSWGTTPRWLFIDEIANHDRGESAQQFIDALLTALPKRRDSVCLTATTPSSPSHWSYALWQTALGGGLWRASLTAGPAPWQDPAELESERRRIPESFWRRLFLCEWAEAQDAIADSAAVEACVRHEGPLDPQPGTAYVIGFDLSVSSDHTAVVVAHLDDSSGQRTVVVDRLEAWVPRAGRQVDLQDVEAWILQAARDYGGAQVLGDMWQAVSMVQRLREAGLQVLPVQFTAAANSRRAQMLLRLVRDRCLDLPADESLRRELLSLRLTEGATPGVVKLTTDATHGHHDRVTALLIAAEHLTNQPMGSYRDLFGKTTECGRCSRWYRKVLTACVFCGEPNEDPDQPQASAILAASAARNGQPPAPEPVTVSPNSPAAAYLPANAVKCAAGHLYDGKANPHHCPNCLHASLGFFRNQGRAPAGISGGMLRGLPGNPR